MALDLTKLTPVGDPGASRMAGVPLGFSYTTADLTAAVATAGYFNNARRQLQVGDHITANVDTGGTRTLKKYLVTAVPVGAGNVTVTTVY